MNLKKIPSISQSQSPNDLVQVHFHKQLFNPHCQIQQSLKIVSITSLCLGIIALAGLSVGLSAHYGAKLGSLDFMKNLKVLLGCKIGTGLLFASSGGATLAVYLIFYRKDRREATDIFYDQRTEKPEDADVTNDYPSYDYSFNDQVQPELREDLKFNLKDPKNYSLRTYEHYVLNCKEWTESIRTYKKTSFLLFKKIKLPWVSIKTSYKNRIKFYPPKRVNSCNYVYVKDEQANPEFPHNLHIFSTKSAALRFVKKLDCKREEKPSELKEPEYLNNKEYVKREERERAFQCY